MVTRPRNPALPQPGPTCADSACARRRPPWRPAVLWSLRLGVTCLLVPALAIAQPQKTAVRGLRIEGNTLLPERTLSALTAGVAGSERSLAELNAVAARIQLAYRDAGYGGVLAYIPPQENTDGTVIVRVVEGKLAQVRVVGNTHFATGNVRAALPNLREGATPLVRAIDRDIQLSNDNPAKQVKVTLTAGARPGEIDANVAVSDSNPVRYLVGYNNTGTSSTGRQRLSIGIQNANLFGRDQVGTLQYQTSPDYPGRVRILSAGYRLPLYAHAASLDAFVAHSSVSIGTTATVAGPLTFTGKGTIAGARANRHLDRIGEYDHHLTLGLDWRDYKDSCAVGDFGAAGCGSAAVDLTAVPLSLAYGGQAQSGKRAWGVNAAVSVNVGGSAHSAFEAVRRDARRHYTVARLAGFVEQAMAGNLSIGGRFELQYSPDKLIPAERFGLGGAASVRSYLERELAGDMGYLVRLDASYALPELLDGLRARPYLFLDHGRVRNHGGTPCRDLAAGACGLSAVGIGVRLGFRRHVSASLDVGRALDRGFATSAGDVRGHIAVNLVF